MLNKLDNGGRYQGRKIGEGKIAFPAFPAPSSPNHMFWPLAPLSVHFPVRRVCSRGGCRRSAIAGLLICLDYFPGDAAAGAAALKARLKTQNAVVLHWDAAQLSSTTAAAAAIDVATPYLDGVLVTTGLGFHGNLADMTLEASDKVLQRLMQVNAIGPSLLSQ